MLSHLNQLLIVWRDQNLHGASYVVALWLGIVLAVATAYFISIAGLMVTAWVTARLGFIGLLVWASYDVVANGYHSITGGSFNSLSMMLQAFVITVVGSLLISKQLFRTIGPARLNYRANIEFHQMRVSKLNRFARGQYASYMNNRPKAQLAALRSDLNKHAQDSPHGDTLRVPDSPTPQDFGSQRFDVSGARDGL